MKTKFYELPEWSFIGGSTQKRSFTLLKISGKEYDLPDAIASLSVVDFVNRRSEPVITKQTPVEVNSTSKYCEVVFALDPADTLNLSGKYLYQVSIKDAYGNLSTPKQGVMYITENIDKSFVM